MTPPCTTRVHTARLAAIRARLEVVTPGPHELYADLGGFCIAGKGARTVASVARRADAEFYAAAADDIAFLLALVGDVGGTR